MRAPRWRRSPPPRRRRPGAAEVRPRKRGFRSRQFGVGHHQSVGLDRNRPCV